MTQDTLRQQTLPFEVKLKSVIQSFRFNCVGTVNKVSSSGERISVVLPYLDNNLQPKIIKGIEVLHLGGHNIDIKYKPVVGDVALVFALQDYVPSCEYNASPEKKKVHFDPYSNVTMKALILHSNTDANSKTSITIDKEKIAIKTDLEVTLDCKKVTINDHLTVE